MTGEADDPGHSRSGASVSNEEFPYLLARPVRVATHLLRLEVLGENALYEITDESGILDALREVLDRCDGSTSMTALEELAGSDWVTVGEAVRALRQANILVEAASVGRAVLAQGWMTRPISPERLAAIVTTSTWQPDRVFRTVAKVKRPKTPRRPPSLSPDHTVRGGEVGWQQLAEILADSYGLAEDGRREVATAGGLADLELHVWKIDEGSSHVRGLWLDASIPGLSDHGMVCDIDNFCCWFIQRSLIDRVLSDGGAVVSVCADLSRSAMKYGHRAALFAAMEAGATAHAMSGAAWARGVKSRTIGGLLPVQMEALVLRGLEPLLAVLLSGA